MRVAAVQLTTGADLDENLTIAEDAIRRAAEQGARLIVLPEATSQAFGTGRLDTAAEGLEGKFATALRLLAAELEVVVVAGTFRPADTIERDGKTINRVYNTALVTGAGLHVGYDKIHTYDAFDYRESDTVRPGTETLVVEVDGQVKYDGVTYGTPTDQVLREERQREKALQNLGYTVLRIGHADMVPAADGSVPIVDLIVQALARRAHRTATP